MDSRLSGYRPLSESTKSPEEDRWKTPPDRSFDGTRPVGARAWVVAAVRIDEGLSQLTLRPDLFDVAALLQLRFKTVCARATGAAAVSPPQQAAQ